MSRISEEPEESLETHVVAWRKVECRAKICSSHSPWILVSDRLDWVLPIWQGIFLLLARWGVMAFKLRAGESTAIDIGRLWSASIMKS